MTIARGITKQLAIKPESSYGVLAGASGAALLRRVTSTFNLAKATYQSAEIRTDYQVADFRHGVRSCAGTVAGELSPGSYSTLMQAALARDFTAGISFTGLSLAVTTTDITRASGSFITDGFKLGDIIRLTAGTGAASDNLNINLLITNVVALDITFVVVNGATITPSPTVTGATLVVQGKKTYVPQTGHTSKSFTVEEFCIGIAQSEVYTGVKVNTMGLTLPSTGISTVNFSLTGKDLTQTGTTQYFTSPSALGTTGVCAGVNGSVIFNGAKVAVITNCTINLNRNLAETTALGSNSIVESVDGRAIVDGNLSLYFIDAAARDAFKNETEVSVIINLTTNNSATADFFTITMPRCKFNSFTKDDGEGAITASTAFTALLNNSNAAGDVTTIVISDSQA